MRFTLRQLEIFVAVARAGSVSRAARQLSLSQSATSTSLGEFERQFDCQLFDRLGKRLRLNELGQHLLPRAAALLDRAVEVEETLRGQAGIGALQVGATLTIGNYLAALLVGAFMRRHPESRIRLHVHNTDTVVDRVANYMLDLGLIEGECNHRDVEVTPWIEDELVVFCAPDHPLADVGQISAEQLFDEAWILREEGSGTRRTLDYALRDFPDRLNIRLELEHTEAIKRAVESGLGIGCISRLALRDAFRRGNLVPLITPQLDLRRQFYFIWHREKYHTAGMQEFLRQCQALTHGIRTTDDLDLSSIPARIE